jgi:hypothetical protein
MKHRKITESLKMSIQYESRYSKLALLAMVDHYLATDNATWLINLKDSSCIYEVTFIKIPWNVKEINIC